MVVCGCSEEREKYHKTLALELKKLRQEVKDIAKHFDDGLIALMRTSLKVKTYVHAQELYLTRLTMAVQDREDAFQRDRVIEDSLDAILTNEAQSTADYEAFVARVDSQERAVQELQRRDKELDRSFRDSIKESVGGSIDAETLRIVTALYKRRNGEAGGGAASRRPVGLRGASDSK